MKHCMSNKKDNGTLYIKYLLNNIFLFSEYRVNTGKLIKPIYKHSTVRHGCPTSKSVLLRAA